MYYFFDIRLELCIITTTLNQKKKVCMLEQKSLCSHILNYLSLNDVSLETSDCGFKPRFLNLTKNITTTTFINVLFGTKNLDKEKLYNLAALTSGLSVSLHENDNYKAYKNIIVTKEPAVAGQIISWCEEVLIVSNVYSDSCTVHSLNGQIYSNNFKFGYSGEPHFVLGFDSSILEVDEKDVFDNKNALKYNDEEMKKTIEMIEKEKNKLLT